MSKESVFLSEKTVVLADVPTGATQEEIAQNLLNLLTQPITVRDKFETVVDRGVSRSVVSYGILQLAEGRKGYIFSVSYIGTPVCGMYFLKEGDNFLTEMIDPNRKKVSQVVREVAGERV